MDAVIDVRPCSEVLAGLSGEVSRAVSSSVGLGQREYFLGALGAGFAVDSIDRCSSERRTFTVQFRLDRAQRESIDIGLLSARVGR